MKKFTVIPKKNYLALGKVGVKCLVCLSFSGERLNLRGLRGFILQKVLTLVLTQVDNFDLSIRHSGRSTISNVQLDIQIQGNSLPLLWDIEVLRRLLSWFYSTMKTALNHN